MHLVHCSILSSVGSHGRRFSKMMPTGRILSTGLTICSRTRKRLPYATRVNSISNFQHSWTNSDDLTVDDLVADTTIQVMDVTWNVY